MNKLMALLGRMFLRVKAKFNDERPSRSPRQPTPSLPDGIILLGEKGEKSKAILAVQYALERSSNPSVVPMGGQEDFQPDSSIYVYMVGKESVVRPRTGVLPEMNIPGCGDGEDYRLILKIPQPFGRYEPGTEAVSGDGRVQFEIYDAKRIAMDFIWSDNWTLDQSLTRADLEKRLPDYIFSYGNNYSEKGIFWSANSPPTTEEIAAAKGRILRQNKFSVVLMREDLKKMVAALDEEPSWQNLQHAHFLEFIREAKAGQEMTMEIRFVKN